MRWILLRGLAREARHWGDFPRLLAAAFPGAEVRTPDVPGNGARWHERTPAQVSAIVDALREPGAPRSYLVGLSLGGMACVDWSVRFPGEVAGCVLINTSLRPFSGFHERLRPRSYATVSRLLFEGDARRREAGILALTSSGAPLALADAWAGYAQEHPIRRGNVLRQLWAASRFRAPPEPPRVPVLVLASGRDRLVDPACSRAIAAQWNAPLALHPDAGHDLPLDAGPWVVEEVKRWLGGLL